MSDAKFTPGPWEMRPVMRYPFGVAVLSRDETVLHQDGACFSSVQDSFDDWKSGKGFDDNEGKFSRAHAVASTARQLANARLIAAAPELFAELQKAEFLLSQVIPVMFNAMIQEHLPFGIADEIKAWARENSAQRAIAKALGQSADAKSQSVGAATSEGE